MIKMFFYMVFGGLLFLMTGVFGILIVNGKAPVGYYFGMALCIVLIYLLFRPRKYPYNRKYMRKMAERDAMFPMNDD